MSAGVGVEWGETGVGGGIAEMQRGRGEETGSKDLSVQRLTELVHAAVVLLRLVAAMNPISRLPLSPGSMSRM